MKRVAAVFLAAFSASCATVKKGEVDDLKPAVKAIYQSIRWKDFRGAAELMVLERQEAFLAARKKLNDDKDLYITNFELEDAKISPDLLTAKAVTRISWYRMPSTTELSATVTNIFIWRDGLWQLESLDDGPFEEMKPEPKKRPDAGSLDGADAGA